ncbi:MAG: hypothetical protein CMG74_07750 [Candidatus Marinimicrobia bacterium]|nr:hypothetical protein [Candidatus Neomarinimicrobiota bacterium]|tara:strand:+ start:18605 stop:19480 length:876 start_codon:yes stop_codon:yes gene_type:complete
MDFTIVLKVNMKINNLHLRTRLKQKLFKKYGLRFLKIRQQELKGKIFEVVGMKITIDYETGWLLYLAKDVDIIFDVGCNTGQTAVLFNAFSKVKKIYLFEPNPYALAICTENAILNGFADKIKIYKNCVSETNNKEILFYTVLAGAAGSVQSDMAKTASHLNESYKTMSITLDEVIKNEKVIPDLVKIDVEGHEYKVLCGSKDLIKRKKTKFIVEMHSSSMLSMIENGTRIINFAKLYDYRVIYLSEMIFLDDASPIQHRGRCHLLLTPPDYRNIDQELKKIRQNALPPNL